MKEVTKIKPISDKNGFSKDGYDFKYLFFDKNNNLIHLENNEEFLYLQNNKICIYNNGKVIIKDD